MPKKQHIIKFILIILVCNLSHSQSKIIGRYSNLMPYQEHYNYFDFNKDGTFDYHSGSCLGDSESGKGHYQIKNDSLILNYDLTELKEESYFRATKYYNVKDSITINLNAYTFKNEPIYNVFIYAYPISKSAETDKKGKAILKLKKQKAKDKIELHIDGEFLAKQTIYIDGNANYNINVYMSKSEIIGFTHPIAYKNQIIKYKIMRLKDDLHQFRTIK